MEIFMEYQTAPATPRLHPLLLGAAGSVILVSLLGAAAITGVLPSSHGSVAPSASPYAEAASSSIRGQVPVSSLALVTPIRYVTTDGRVLEEVPNTQRVAPVYRSSAVYAEQAYQPAPVARHRAVHHYAQNTRSQPARGYEQPYSTQQQGPTQSYVSDMNPVGTGLGAVVGGLLGNQVGGGNGKKIATVAGVLLGGYAGNEVAHNRNPLPW
jgi:uncharacterized protein YcfJ